MFSYQVADVFWNDIKPKLESQQQPTALYGLRAITQKKREKNPEPPEDAPKWWHYAEQWAWEPESDWWQTSDWHQGGDWWQSGWQQSGGSSSSNWWQRGWQ